MSRVTFLVHLRIQDTTQVLHFILNTTTEAYGNYQACQVQS
jgi:hypothetical protein